jgi:hypothetical protein
MEINAMGNACGYCARTEKALGIFGWGHLKEDRRFVRWIILI